ncbi:MAG: UDP-2,3-diacylglucosamine diphosphatase LpxI [Alphaproteobacteria bacterium]|nr:UDP-2,3-diacylglucosamine diphosphatase LpxI [Alphaproteobacteria bacterium]OJV45115.1 MAG: hypothetical protein BGO28_05655 [Alphaproteobacteria bacterium 43-37]
MGDIAAHKIGIIAGQGFLPKLLIEACKSQGRPFFVLALENQTDSAILKDVPHAWNRIGAVGKSIEILKSQGITCLVMAGGVRRPSWLELRPDFKAAEVLATLGVKAFGDDGILKGLIDFLEKEGFSVVGAHEIIGGILASNGNMTKSSPSPEDMEDIRRAFIVAKTLGSVDVGQGVVVQQGIVLAVEAVEGTDLMLSRIPIARERVKGLGKGGVLVKASKPNQEQRIDLPTIGLRTLELILDHKLNGIALEAKKCLIIDKETLIQRSNERGVFIYGVELEGQHA